MLNEAVQDTHTLGTGLVSRPCHRQLRIARQERNNIHDQASCLHRMLGVLSNSRRLICIMCNWQPMQLNKLVFSISAFAPLGVPMLTCGLAV